MNQIISGFGVIDTKTGEYPDLWEIALKEDWAKHLMYCDMDGFAIEEDGTLLLLDECGKQAYCPEGRFKIVPRTSNDPLTIEQLREMDGEPVWTVGVSCTNDGKWAMWDIVEKADDEGVDFGYSTEGREWWNYNLRGNDGKLLNCAWACYRRPPEGEEET